MILAERHIFFDETAHKYVDQYGNPYTPVSNAYGRYKIPFKSNYWARKKALETNTSEASIKAQWKHINENSVGIGNKKHNKLETAIKTTSKFHKAVNIITINNVTRCYSIFDLIDNGDIGEMSLDAFYKKIGNKYLMIFEAIKYYVSNGYKIYSEINVYDPINLISGTIDVLLVKGTDFVIIDWKTNRNEIKFEAGFYAKDKATNELTNVWVPRKKYMFYPLDNVEDCGGNHYSLQLSMYANMVEQFGYSNVAILLFHIRDSYILNKYGQPRKDKRGFYIIDDTKPEQVQPHVIRYMKNEAERIREHVGRDAVVQTQQKFIM